LTGKSHGVIGLVESVGYLLSLWGIQVHCSINNIFTIQYRQNIHAAVQVIQQQVEFVLFCK